MKSRATTYMLIAGVTIVWGIVVWKILSPEDKEQYVDTAQKTTGVTGKTADTLMLNYRDPFLGAPPASEKTTASSASVRQSPVAAEVNPYEHMEHRLRYMGKITKKKIVYGLVEINGTLHTMKTGETVDGYRLESISENSMKLVWNGIVCTVASDN